MNKVILALLSITTLTSFSGTRTWGEFSFDQFAFGNDFAQAAQEEVQPAQEVVAVQDESAQVVTQEASIIQEVAASEALESAPAQEVAAEAVAVPVAAEVAPAQEEVAVQAPVQEQVAEVAIQAPIAQQSFAQEEAPDYSYFGWHYSARDYQMAIAAEPAFAPVQEVTPVAAAAQPVVAPVQEAAVEVVPAQQEVIAVEVAPAPEAVALQDAVFGFVESVQIIADPPCTFNLNTATLPSAGTVTVTTTSPAPAGSVFHLTSFTTGLTTSITTTAAATSTVTFTNVCPGRYLLVAVDGNCCNTASQVVNVTAAPPITLTICPTPAAVCQGGAATFIANVTPADNYTYTWWTNPATTVGTGPLFTVAPTVSPTTVFAQANKVGTCCSSNIGSATVTVNTPPAFCIGGDINVCTGGIITLTVTNLTGTAPFTFSWRNPAGTVISTAQTVTITNASAANQGTYTVTVTDARGCTETHCVFVTVNANPRVTVRDVCVRCGDTLTLTANEFFGRAPFTFSWTGPDCFSVVHTNVNTTTDTITISPATKASAGCYFVTVTDANGCSAQATATVQVKKPKKDRCK